MASQILCPLLETWTGSGGRHSETSLAADLGSALGSMTSLSLGFIIYRTGMIMHTLECCPGAV